MKRCPITYELIDDQKRYSKRGLRLLAPQLNQLNPLTLNADQLRNEAINRIGKMSIQGMQPKLSAQLRIKQGYFEFVDRYGHYIIKPPSDSYLELPENEAITMTLAETIGLEVPVHGLLYASDDTKTYFIKRFDRMERGKKFATEDFAQLSNKNRHTKYDSSMEKVIKLVKNFCTFPKIELVKLFKLTLFNFLIGNEDMHLKNFSIITRNNITSLSPVYDLLNTSIAIKNVQEEIALPLKGKKNNLTKNDILNYFAVDQLELKDKILVEILNDFQQAIPKWKQLITISFLSSDMQHKYLRLLADRCNRLDITNYSTFRCY